MAQDQNFAYVKDIRPGQKNINIVFIVLEIGKATKTKDGHDVRSCKVADKTGCINISVWDEKGSLVQTGDICKLIKGYASLWKGCLTLYTGKGGDIQKIGEFCMPFSESPNMSEQNPEAVAKMQEQLISNSGQRKSPTEQHNPTSESGPMMPGSQTPANRPHMMPHGGMPPMPNGRPQMMMGNHGNMPPHMRNPPPNNGMGMMGNRGRGVRR